MEGRMVGYRLECFYTRRYDTPVPGKALDQSKDVKDIKLQLGFVWEDILRLDNWLKVLEEPEVQP